MCDQGRGRVSAVGQPQLRRPHQQRRIDELSSRTGGWGARVRGGNEDPVNAAGPGWPASGRTGRSEVDGVESSAADGVEQCESSVGRVDGQGADEAGVAVDGVQERVVLAQRGTRGLIEDRVGRCGDGWIAVVGGDDLQELPVTTGLGGDPPDRDAGTAGVALAGGTGSDVGELGARPACGGSRAAASEDGGLRRRRRRCRGRLFVAMVRWSWGFTPRSWELGGASVGGRTA
jgi:hypothetical protein